MDERLQPDGGPRRPRAVRLIGFLAALAATALTAGCLAEGPRPAAGDTVPAAPSGVEGQTFVDVGCPVLASGARCPWRPLPARVVILDCDAREVTRTDTSETGRFRVELPPGDYLLQGQNMTSGPLPVAAPVQVRIHAARFEQVIIQFDSRTPGTGREPAACRSEQRDPP